jgi:hypothetical protein
MLCNFTTFSASGVEDETLTKSYILLSGLGIQGTKLFSKGFIFPHNVGKFQNHPTSTIITLSALQFILNDRATTVSSLP